MTFNHSLKAADLALERGRRLLFERLSFNLAPGEWLLVTGPNGSGKTSLLRALAGLIPLTGGSVQLEGGEGAPAEFMHFIGHANAVKTQLTARENLRFWIAMLSNAQVDAPDARVDAALAAFGLAHLADVEGVYFSAGQKRRLALARLLLCPRPIWLLDEPVTALDDRSRGIFAAAMRGHLAQGGTIIAASHDDLRLAPTRTLSLGGAS